MNCTAKNCVQFLGCSSLGDLIQSLLFHILFVSIQSD
nr:MAG TPA: hypothetical protein [Caudoviricetes sp.]